MEKKIINLITPSGVFLSLFSVGTDACVHFFSCHSALKLSVLFLSDRNLSVWACELRGKHFPPFATVWLRHHFSWFGVKEAPAMPRFS